MNGTLLLVALPLVAVGGLLGLAWAAGRRPACYRIVRSLPIQAPPERLFLLINELQSFQEWNPLLRGARWQAQGASVIASGVGARSAGGAGRIGDGSLTITESLPAQQVVMTLGGPPGEQAHRARFSLLPIDGATVVEAVVEGPAPYAERLKGLLLNRDQNLGRDLEAGLYKLKRLAERRKPAR